jgi:hypothetical protein
MSFRQHSSAAGLIEARPSSDRCRALCLVSRDSIKCAQCTLQQDRPCSVSQLVEHSRLVSSIRNLDYQIGTSELQLESCSSAVGLAYRALKLAVSSLEYQQQKFSDELAHLSDLKQQRDALIGPGILDDEQPAVASTSASDGLVRQEPCSESSF